MGDSRKIKIETQTESDEEMTQPVDDEKARSESDTESEEPESTPEDNDIAAMKEKLDVARDEAKDNYDRLLRLSAEFDNYKKRTTREVSEFKKYANELLLKDLLGVVDNLERAINAASGDSTSGDTPSGDSASSGALVEGVDLTLKEILKILERNSVKPIESVGQPFDPSFHQAMMQQEVQDQPNNMVLQEMQKGYMIHDRLLRPAMVVVSKSSGDSVAEENK